MCADSRWVSPKGGFVIRRPSLACPGSPGARTRSPHSLTLRQAGDVECAEGSARYDRLGKGGFAPLRVAFDAKHKGGPDDRACIRHQAGQGVLVLQVTPVGAGFVAIASFLP